MKKGSEMLFYRFKNRTDSPRRRTAALLAAFFLAASLGAGALFAADSTASTRDFFNDPLFERGFRVATSGKPLGVLRLPLSSEESESASAPVWALATHASKYDLANAPRKLGESESSASTPGQTVSRRLDENGELVLTLSVDASKEYDAPRTADRLWIHLLLERNWDPKTVPSFGDVESLVFSADARIADWKRLMTDEEFNPGLHATQVSVYFAISNVNPKSPDYTDYIWFGVSFFDDRHEIQSNYVAIDGDPKTIGTGKLIYRIGDQKTIDDVCGGVNPYFQDWVHIEFDATRYVGDMLKAAQERGMLTQTTLDDLKVVHFNFGWETPGTYRSTLEMKNLRLVATEKNAE